MKEGNVLRDKSYAFALRVVKTSQYLTGEKHEYVLSKQLLRSGTAIGANVEEALGGQSDKDFSAKLAIAYKEARETHYWIRLLRDSEYPSSAQSASLLTDVDELLRILGSILKTMKSRNLNH
ncbi:four helix bundle protein [Promineifilum sp.]|uniref:four helix bundle protein n=1 Tax=Promineifilum sp. TaxID=2664178 RepID=UPI0035AF5603